MDNPQTFQNHSCDNTTREQNRLKEHIEILSHNSADKELAEQAYDQACNLIGQPLNESLLDVLKRLLGLVRSILTSPEDTSTSNEIFTVYLAKLLYDPQPLDRECTLNILDIFTGSKQYEITSFLPHVTEPKKIDAEVFSQGNEDEIVLRSLKIIEALSSSNEEKEKQTRSLLKATDENEEYDFKLGIYLLEHEDYTDLLLPLIAKKLEAHESLEELSSILAYDSKDPDFKKRVWQLFELLSANTVNKILDTSRNQLSGELALASTMDDALFKEIRASLAMSSSSLLHNDFLKLLRQEIPDFFAIHRSDDIKAICTAIADHKANLEDHLTYFKDGKSCPARLVDLTNISIIYINTLQDAIQAGLNIELLDNPNERAYQIAITSAKILYDHKEYQSALEVITAVDPSIKIDNPELVAELNQIQSSAEKTLQAEKKAEAKAIETASPETSKQLKKSNVTHWGWYLLIGVIAFISVAAVALWAGIPALFSGSTAAAGSASIGATAKAVTSPGVTQSATTPVVSSQF